MNHIPVEIRKHADTHRGRYVIDNEHMYWWIDEDGVFHKRLDVAEDARRWRQKVTKLTGITFFDTE